MGSLYKRANVYWIKFYHHGRPFRESTKTTDETKAQKLLRYREVQVETGTFQGFRIERVKLEELAQDFLNDYKIDGRKSIRDADLFVRRLMEHFKEIRVLDITTPLIQEYILKRQNEGLANATINRHLSALKRMLHLGARQTPPKLLHIPYIPMLKENNARSGFFEHDEFLALHNALPDYLKPVVTMAYYTGFRRKEILSLRWDQVDMERKRIVLEAETTKNNEGRVVYMTENLYRVLSRWKHLRDIRFPTFSLVCFRLKGGKPVVIRDFRKVWNRALEKIGLEGKILHDFRRTAVRNMVRAGITERVAMHISGHKTRSVFDRYNITNEADIQQAAGKLDALYKSKNGHNPGTIGRLEAPLV